MEFLVQQHCTYGTIQCTIMQYVTTAAGSGVYGIPCIDSIPCGGIRVQAAVDGHRSSPTGVHHAIWHHSVRTTASPSEGARARRSQDAKDGFCLQRYVSRSSAWVCKHGTYTSFSTQRTNAGYHELLCSCVGPFRASGIDCDQRHRPYICDRPWKDAREAGSGEASTSKSTACT